MFAARTTTFSACELALVSELGRLRAVCSEALRATVDRCARWPDAMRTLLPDAPIDAVYALSEEIGRPRHRSSPRGVDHRLRHETKRVSVVRDVATDRFVLPAEALPTPPLHRRSRTAPPPRARTRELLGRLRDLDAASSLRVKLYEDPLTWLAMIGVRIHERRWMAELV